MEGPYSDLSDNGAALFRGNVVYYNNLQQRFPFQKSSYQYPSNYAGGTSFSRSEGWLAPPRSWAKWNFLFKKNIANTWAKTFCLKIRVHMRKCQWKYVLVAFLINLPNRNQVKQLKWASGAAAGRILWKIALKNFAKFTRKQLCRNLFFNKDAYLFYTPKHVWKSLFFLSFQVVYNRPATWLKNRLPHKCFPVNFTKNL